MIIYEIFAKKILLDIYSNNDCGTSKLLHGFCNKIAIVKGDFVDNNFFNANFENLFDLFSSRDATTVGKRHKTLTGKFTNYVVSGYNLMLRCINIKKNELIYR